MARMIPRIHPWAVTGTPIGKHGLTDLHGLIKFLHIEPLASSSHIWNRLLLPSNTSILFSTLGLFMHRNTKKSVAGELTLPPQSQRLLRLEFSRVERTWYDQLYQQMLEELGNVQSTSGNTNKVEEAKKAWMSSWLLQLRQTW